MQGKTKNPSVEGIAEFRVNKALNRADVAEMRFDARINDPSLKESIKNTFNDVDMEKNYIGFVGKHEKADFLDNPYFNQMTPRQLRAVEMYIDALIELTFAQSKLLGLPFSEEAWGGEFVRF